MFGDSDKQRFDSELATLRAWLIEHEERALQHGDLDDASLWKAHLELLEGLSIDSPVELRIHVSLLSANVSLRSVNRSRPSLAQAEIGDPVVIKRNLSHPAWCDRTENEYGEGIYTPRAGISEVVGIGRIRAMDRKHSFGQPSILLLKVSNNLWYQATDGLQQHSESTYIELA